MGKQRLIMIIVWLCLLCSVGIGLFDGYLTWKNREEFQKIEERIMDETIPGISEFENVVENGVLRLRDVGYGEVNIAVGNPRKNSASLWLWTDVERSSATLHIGDEIVFGGYRIELCDIRFEGSRIAELARWIAGYHPKPFHFTLKISLTEMPRKP